MNQKKPNCAFLLDDGTKCPNPAVRTVRVRELNVDLPCCDICNEDRQVGIVNYEVKEDL